MRIAFLLGVAGFILMSQTDAPAPTVDRKLIVITYPANPIDHLSLKELRRYFRAEQKHWPDGSPVVLIMRETYSKERALVLEKIYRMDETRYKRFWLEKVFRGEATRPQTAMSPITMRELVAQQKGALGYLWQEDTDTSVKTVLVDNHPVLAVGREVPPPPEAK